MGCRGVGRLIDASWMSVPSPEILHRKFNPATARTLDTICIQSVALEWSPHARHLPRPRRHDSGRLRRCLPGQPTTPPTRPPPVSAGPTRTAPPASSSACQTRRGLACGGIPCNVEALCATTPDCPTDAVCMPYIGGCCGPSDQRSTMCVPPCTDNSQCLDGWQCAADQIGCEPVACDAGYSCPAPHPVRRRKDGSVAR